MEQTKAITKTIQGKITNVAFEKSGVKGNGEPWTIYKVFIDSKEFKTFDKGFLDKIGEEGEWIYKEEERTSPRGTPYTSKTLLGISEKKYPNPQENKPQPIIHESVELEFIQKGFGVLREDITRIEKKLDILLEGTGAEINKNVDTSDPDQSKSEWKRE